MNTLLMVGQDSNPDGRLDRALESFGFALASAADEDDMDDFEPADTRAVIMRLSGTRGDAFRLMHRMRRALPQMLIIAIAPFRDAAIEQHALRCGANFVLVEPVHPKDLAAFIAGYTGLSQARAMA